MKVLMLLPSLILTILPLSSFADEPCESGNYSIYMSDVGAVGTLWGGKIRIRNNGVVRGHWIDGKFSVSLSSNVKALNDTYDFTNFGANTHARMAATDTEVCPGHETTITCRYNTADGDTRCAVNIF